jgi:hypothetical protein
VLTVSIDDDAAGEMLAIMTVRPLPTNDSLSTWVSLLERKGVYDELASVIDRMHSLSASSDLLISCARSHGSQATNVGSHARGATAAAQHSHGTHQRLATYRTLHASLLLIFCRVRALWRHAHTQQTSEVEPERTRQLKQGRGVAVICWRGVGWRIARHLGGARTFSLPARSMKDIWPCSLPRGLRRVICKMAWERDDCSFMPVVLVERNCQRPTATRTRRQDTSAHTISAVNLL